ncbi:hypothetical protein EDD21DRAFT_234065 [Dissophora ornata]|nr:hypothetical protein BGZ58_008706 [Dissophora ornata]KAI8606419.1 hypothetical protein EDD21DRAFT_234065 [Dissophora ornata]
MKFTLSAAVLALAASQAMAVVPIPIKGCTKTVVITPADLSCSDFATANGCTFADLLKWNTKLRTDCANLDVGASICVSVSAGAGGSSTVSTGTATGTAATGKTTATATGKTTTSTAPSTAASTTTSAATVAPTSAKPSSANASKASMVLGAAGVLLSVVYML